VIEISELVEVPAAPRIVWDVLSDPRAVVDCMPGAKLGDRLEDGSYDATVTVKFGPAKVTFRAKVALELDGAAMVGHVSTAGFSNMLFNKPRSLLLPGHFFGCIGQMLPAAMGAVAASGNTPHVLVNCDASVVMHVAEFETAVRYGMPLMVVCLNNQTLGSEYYKFDAHKMKADLATVPSPDLGAVGKAFGGRGA